MQLLRFHSVHLLNILRAVEERSVKSKVLPILQVHFPTYLSSAVGLKDGPEIYEFSDFVHLQNAVFAKSVHMLAILLMRSRLKIAAGVV